MRAYNFIASKMLMASNLHQFAALKKSGRLRSRKVCGMMLRPTQGRSKDKNGMIDLVRQDHTAEAAIQLAVEWHVRHLHHNTTFHQQQVWMHGNDKQRNVKSVRGGWRGVDSGRGEGGESSKLSCFQLSQIVWP